MLPRRNGMRLPSCRSKGKVVIRVGKIYPSVPGRRFTRRTRNLISIVAVVASLAGLAMILDRQYGGFRPGHASEGELPDMLGSQDSAGGVAALSPAEENRYRALGDFVARKYRVSQEMAYDLVHLAHSVGHQLGIDPLLIIAVIAIESRFNPIAESVAGAKGLMQIIPKYHIQKFAEYGGEKAAFDPVANVKIGALILKEYIRLTGNVGIALQMYAGALGDTEDQYTTKVMNEQQRLRQVVSPRNAYIKTTSSPSPVKAKLD